jgi:putative membrane protein
VTVRLTIVTALVLLVAGTDLAHADSPRGPTERFVEQAAARSLAGLELSDLALQRSESAAVRRLARRTHDEQAQSYEALLGLATGAGTTAAPPDTIDLEQRGIKSRLAALRGADFDRAYVNALRTNEDRDIALYRAYAQKGSDATLKEWATDRLQLIRRRRQLIEATALEIPR